ncbi:ATP-binding protein [Laspinema olomoucense]|uniref:ATP-binding protein n=1 Tax=Laspinema olomoucense D3b TaxID=2953688 RepID=A0ABT2N9V2_9CYAN|nr:MULTISPECIES: ATP-binding protein [unclassified Laspinema]MCT7971406.1 ATP-binding protein [Laspinema sp. D3d]MCT7979473.1 ATP-binding protein [Laspinema sp. D3b]MCT7987277.1 ATP-binding protein [Laspinema sp. D3a]
MVSIDTIIQRSVNPFDPISFKTGNFWRESQEASLTVDSIHKEAMVEIETWVDQMAQDHHSRTIMLLGDPGSGKSYLLGRLKKTLKPKAFFAYIPPWSDHEWMRRHLLRHTVDSLMQVPEGETDSQLMLWLKSLSAFTNRSLKQRIFDDQVWTLLQSNRKKFITHLKKTYQSLGIAQADSFFGILYDLTNPELYPIACEWLRGDDLSEDSLQDLKLKHSIESEEAAWEILANLGKISTETQPIVLCLDNVELVGMGSGGSLNLQPLLSLNTRLHLEGITNFLIIINMVQNSWKIVRQGIQNSDKAGIHKLILLKRIGLDEAEAIWANRLYSLHQKVSIQPLSPIYPLTRKDLEEKFPSGKTAPRLVLQLGRQLIEEYKIGQPPPPADYGSGLKLLWVEEFKKTQKKVAKISYFSAPERIQMLQAAMEALRLPVAPKFLLSDKLASYSLSYQPSGGPESIGVVWSEDPNMKTFFFVMDACRRSMAQHPKTPVYLIRAEKVEESKLKGYKLYKELFTGSPHRHITPRLNSLHYLGTYYTLVKEALAGELVIVDQVITLERLQKLIRETEILQGCILLQDLGMVPAPPKTDSDPSQPEVDPQILAAKDFILDMVITQQFLGREMAIDNAHANFDTVSPEGLNQLIDELIQEGKIDLIGSESDPKTQVISRVPQV